MVVGTSGKFVRWFSKISFKVLKVLEQTRAVRLYENRKRYVDS